MALKEGIADAIASAVNKEKTDSSRMNPFFIWRRFIG
jgi:hypothetical protein